MRSREQLVALRPLGGALGLQTMRFADELVPKQDLELPSLSKKPSDAEVKMAGQLIDMLHGDWDPAAHEDTYRDAVRAMIESKAAGAKLPAAKRRSLASDDLVAALEASLAGGGKPAAKAPPKSATAKPGPSRPKRAPTAGKGRPATPAPKRRGH